jgi:hypothetical protein
MPRDGDEDRHGGSLDSELGGGNAPDTGDDNDNHYDDHEVHRAVLPEEAPVQGNPHQRKEEEDPLEKQRRKERKEFKVVVGVAVLILVVVVVTVTSIVVTRQRQQDAASQPDPTPSPTQAPTSRLVNNPQDKLDYLLWDVENNRLTKDYTAVLSDKASDMEGKYQDPNEHPVTRAMSWLFADTNNQASDLLRRLGLASVYYSNGGDAWQNQTNWLTPASHCEWYGVQCCGEDDLDVILGGCHDRGTLIQLDLSSNNLSGNLSNVFAFLQDLRVLDLSSNSLTGTLPGELFGSMPNLLTLSLHDNDLTGTVPSDLRSNGVLGTLSLSAWVPSPTRSVVLWLTAFFPIPFSIQTLCSCNATISTELGRLSTAR